MTDTGGCCGGRGASVAAAQAQQSRTALPANEKWKIKFSDGSTSASTYPDKKSADIALARSPLSGDVVKA